MGDIEFWLMGILLVGSFLSGFIFGAVIIEYRGYKRQCR